MRKIIILFVLFATWQIISAHVSLSDVLRAHEAVFGCSKGWEWSIQDNDRDSIYNSDATKKFKINQMNDSVVIDTNEFGYSGIFYTTTQAINLGICISEPGGFGDEDEPAQSIIPIYDNKPNNISTLISSWTKESMEEYSRQKIEKGAGPYTFITLAIVKDGKVRYRMYNSKNQTFWEVSCPNNVERYERIEPQKFEFDNMFTGPWRVRPVLPPVTEGWRIPLKSPDVLYRRNQLEMDNLQRIIK